MLDLFFPRLCLLCGKPVGKGPVICRTCLNTLPRTEQAAHRGNLTEELFYDVPAFQRAAVFFFFKHGDKYHQLLHSMKYGRFADPAIGYILAKEAAYDFMQSDFFDAIDVIIPVPLHPIRLRERGFNQAEWIAKALAEATSIPMKSTLLTRIRHNEHQARLAKNERKMNVRNLFALNHPEELYHKHILLVDDIITTGETIHACIEALKPARDCKISVFGLGKVQ